MSQATAKLRSARVSSQKARLVANQIRGKHIEEALGILTFAPQKSAYIIKKILESAIANAENNFQYDIDNLVVKEAFCGKQVIMKRFRARAKGRAAEIMKPYSNVTIVLSEQMKQKEKEHGTKG